MFESRQLFRNVDSEVIGDLDISSLDYDVGSRSCGILGTLDGGVLDEKRGLRKGSSTRTSQLRPRPTVGRRQIPASTERGSRRHQYRSTTSYQLFSGVPPTLVRNARECTVPTKFI